MKRAAVITALSLAAAFAAGAADARIPPPYKNCTQFNHVYPHGVGRAGARDAVRGDTEPVTTFKRSTALYNRANAKNGSLDRDNDGVACEKA